MKTPPAPLLAPRSVLVPVALDASIGVEHQPASHGVPPSPTRGTLASLLSGLWVFNGKQVRRKRLVRRLKFATGGPLSHRSASRGTIC